MDKYLKLNARNGLFEIVDGGAYTGTYEMLKQNVEGLIERILYFPKLEKEGIDCWCNEEGKLLGLEPALVVLDGTKYYDVVLGNIMFTRTDEEGNTIPLKDSDINIIVNQFGNQKTLSAYGWLPAVNLEVEA